MNQSTLLIITLFCLPESVCLLMRLEKIQKLLMKRKLKKRKNFLELFLNIKKAEASSAPAFSSNIFI